MYISEIVIYISINKMLYDQTIFLTLHPESVNVIIFAFSNLTPIYCTLMAVVVTPLTPVNIKVSENPPKTVQKSVNQRG